MGIKKELLKSASCSPLAAVMTVMMRDQQEQRKVSLKAGENMQWSYAARNKSVTA